MRALLVAGLVLVLAHSLCAQVEAQRTLMPMPASVHAGNGELVIDRNFRVSVNGNDPVVERGIRRFLQQLSLETGMMFAEKSGASTPVTLQIQCDHGSEKIQKLGDDESYVLGVTSTAAKLTAPTPLGVLHGLETMLQLARAGSKGFSIPAV